MHSHTPVCASLATRARSAARSLTRPSWTTLALVAILAVSVVLRVRGLSWGLPYSFQNADEGLMVEKGFHMAQGHPNPNWFLYPSFFFAMLATTFWITAAVLHGSGAPSFMGSGALVVDPTPYFLAARVLVVVCGTASVYLLYRLGREAYSRPVGLLAALFLGVAPLHVRYSHVAVTDVPAVTFGLLSLVLLVAAARRSSPRLVVLGAIAAGLATSTKYNLGMLVVPALIAAWYVACDVGVARRARPLAWFAARRVAAPMTIAFVVGSPFALLDVSHFVRDVWHQRDIVANGWLGFENVSNGYWYNLVVNLPGSLGPVLVVLGLGGLAFALWRHRRVDLILGAYALAYYLYVSSWSELMDRYLLPIVPVLILLAARACVAALRPVRVRRHASAFATALAVACLVAVAFVVPLQASIHYSSGLSGVDIRTVAKSWVEHHVAPGTVIAVEPYGPPLVRRIELPHYAAVGTHPPAYRIVDLKLPLPNTADRRRTPAFLSRRDVRYVIVSSEVYDRVLAAADHYPTQERFYHFLATQAHLVKAFAPGPGEQGPVIKVYRLDRDLPPVGDAT
jgi:4-amino-4-deoxy-L-arabinose transferase-like glycosyltransferase